MAGFRKAKTAQAALKIGMYGPAGSGKTFTALLLSEGLARLSKKRIAYVDSEHGTDFYCQNVPSRSIHPEAFDFDALYTRSLTETTAAVRALDPLEYDVIVIDSITHFWEAAMQAYSGKLTTIGTIPFHAWGKIKKPYKDLMAYLLSSSMHVIICGRQKTEYATDEETEELKAIGVAMRAEGETPYEPHILIRMEAIKPKRTHEVAQIVAYAEKDRTGVLAGRSFINPTFNSLCKPLLGLLGTEQAQMQTGDETASQDAEALAEQEKERLETGEALHKNYVARLTLVQDIDGLKAIGAELTPPIKAKLGPDNVANLRELYLEREKQFSKLEIRGHGSHPSPVESEGAQNHEPHPLPAPAGKSLKKKEDDQENKHDGLEQILTEIDLLEKPTYEKFLNSVNNRMKGMAVQEQSRIIKALEKRRKEIAAQD